jgi:hypothetical protein
MKKIFSFIMITAVSTILLASAVSAQVLTNTGDAGGLQEMTNTVASTAHFSDVTIGYVVANIIRTALGLLATVFLILTIIAGFQWMTAAGNEEQVKKAQTSMKNAIIGLVIVLAAYALTYFILKYLPFSGGETMPPAV